MRGEPVLDGVLRHEELCKANNVLWRQTQREFYSAELRILSSGDDDEMAGRKTVEKQSRIYNLIPFLDEEGVLRMRGRIGEAADVPYSAKYPVILPGNSKLAELIADHYHQCKEHFVSFDGFTPLQPAACPMTPDSFPDDPPLLLSCGDLLFCQKTAVWMAWR
uniref:Uncharacterized protein n=1 Tax=Anopheles stephensi TaxID=30069 RepID=A0A182YQT1_ANOST